VVLHALPEGALGVYPEKTWQQMRRSEARPEEKVGSSIAYRRQARRFGAMTEVQKLSKQGRLTIPTLLRDVLELGPGVSAVLVGSEIGLEIWNEQRWQNELKAIMEHEQRKAALEMEADLNET
jgi:DNA-binding transcriptional regulator/RsmH inhibitor MraZ